MPRSRAPELPQRPSPRAPTLIRTSNSDSDPIHHRSRTTGGRSPRGAQSEPVHQRKLGSRIADLESQLGQAQEELKCLKDQLVSAEAAKRAAQEQLQKKSRAPSSDEIQETDVFEVPMEKSGLECKSEVEKMEFDEMGFLKSKLEVKDKELEVFREENVKMKRQIHEKTVKISSAETEIEELNMRLKEANQELEKRKCISANMNEKVEATERAKEALENEMKMLRVQTEQWRKAADAAASVLAGEVGMNGRRISDRCGSMNGFEHARGYAAGSPGFGDESDDVYGGGKRKGSGIKMFGDLWRKKGNK